MILSRPTFWLPPVSAVLIAAPFLWPPLFPLTWFAFVPFLFALDRSSSSRHSIGLGFCLGAITIAIGFHWIVYTIHVFGGVNYPLALVGFALFCLYSAMPFALFALLIRLCGTGPLGLWPPVFWVTGEFWFPNLFPWYLASSQSWFTPLLQSADMVGLYATSFLLVWFNTVLFTTARTLARGRIVELPAWAAAAVCATLAATLVYGHVRLGQVSAIMKAAPRLRVAAVQGNIGIARKDDARYLRTNLEAYHALSNTAPEADLLIWPESALESWVPEGAARLPDDLLPPEHPPMIVGTMSFRREPGGTRSFNSAFLVDRSGRVLGRYHKQILLAFGEYIPFAGLLGNLPGMPPIGEGFTPGDLNDTFDIAGAKIAPLICYEDLMPRLSRGFVENGSANLLVNLTNDAWYGKSAAPWEHARLAQWRAIETRRAMVRATNTGLTTVIAPTGKIEAFLPIFTEGVLETSVPLLEIETPYVRGGDWFVFLVTGVALLALARRAVFH